MGGGVDFQVWRRHPAAEGSCKNVVPHCEQSPQKKEENAQKVQENKINFIEFVPESTSLLGYDMTLKQCVCACVDEKPHDAFVRVNKNENWGPEMEHLSWIRESIGPSKSIVFKIRLHYVAVEMTDSGWAVQRTATFFDRSTLCLIAVATFSSATDSQNDHSTGIAIFQCYQ